MFFFFFRRRARVVFRLYRYINFNQSRVGTKHGLERSLSLSLSFSRALSLVFSFTVSPCASFSVTLSFSTCAHSVHPSIQRRVHAIGTVIRSHIGWSERRLSGVVHGQSGRHKRRASSVKMYTRAHERRQIAIIHNSF